MELPPKTVIATQTDQKPMNFTILFRMFADIPAHAGVPEVKLQACIDQQGFVAGNQHEIFQELKFLLGQGYEQVVETVPNMIPTRQVLAQILKSADEEFEGGCTPEQMADYILLELTKMTAQVDKGAMEEAEVLFKMNHTALELTADDQNFSKHALRYMLRYYMQAVAAQRENEVKGGL